jgi:hypothetical protein
VKKKTHYRRRGFVLTLCGRVGRAVRFPLKSATCRQCNRAMLRIIDAREHARNVANGWEEADERDEPGCLL